MINALIVSAALLWMQDAPPPIAPVNEPTDSAKAVYLADAAAKNRGNRSEIAVLGTAHLRNLPDGFDFTRFDPLIDKLAAWAPERIAIERMSGHQCDYVRDYTFYYEDRADYYCYDPALARETLNITGPEAAKEIRRLLAEPLDERPATERRQLAGLFLAAGEPASAVVQWLRLSPAERRTGDGLTGALVEVLNTQSSKKNEDIIIAAKLAAKLGHERVYAVDDQTYGRLSDHTDDEAYARELQDIWNNDWAKKRHSIEDGWHNRLINDPQTNVIDWYRLLLNTPEAAHRAVAGDFGAAAGADTPHNTGREYLAYWEYRNLRMVANIREVIGSGHRTLAIVGAAHKAHYERYLGVTSDLEIVDIQKILE